MWLAVRAVVWAAVLPGMSVFFVPWRFFGVANAAIDTANPRHLAALAVMTAGTGLLMACIWEFARRGRGTLSPADPPRHLVVDGLYRHVRNPMYVSATAILLGEILLAPSRGLIAYALCWFTAVNLFVLGYEEPKLRALFPREYDAYTRAVPRWIPRLAPWQPPHPLSS